MSALLPIFVTGIARAQGSPMNTSDPASQAPEGPLVAEPPPVAPPATATSVPAVPAPPAPKKSEESSCKFAYHGFLRAPLRLGVGKRLDSDLPPGYDISGSKVT